jgi:hypothetical protein
MQVGEDDSPDNVLHLAAEVTKEKPLWKVKIFFVNICPKTPKNRFLRGKNQPIIAQGRNKLKKK